MKKETQVTIQNNFIWALACIGWVFMLTEFYNSYYEFVDMPIGIAPPLQYVGLLLFQIAFYGVFVLAFPVIFVSQSIDYIQECRRSGKHGL